MCFHMNLQIRNINIQSITTILLQLIVLSYELTNKEYQLLTRCNSHLYTSKCFHMNLQIRNINSDTSCTSCISFIVLSYELTNKEYQLLLQMFPYQFSIPCFHMNLQIRNINLLYDFNCIIKSYSAFI